MRVAPFTFHGGFPVLGYDAEMDFIHVAVFHGDVRAGIIPDALDGDDATLGLDLVDEIVAHGASRAIGVSLFALLGNFVRLHFVAFLVEGLREVEAGAGADAVVGPFVDEALDCGAVPVVLGFSIGLVLAEVQAPE